MEKMKNEYSKIVGNNIRKYREMNYMSQTELANRIGVKQAAYSLYENGDRDPSTEMIYKICDTLQIEFNELFNPIGVL